MITREQVIGALRHVNDPDFRQDLVTLKMVGDVVIDGSSIHIHIILTTPACPLKGKLEADISAAIRQHVSPDATVNVEFSSRVTTKRVDDNVLPGVKNIIAVASGKGGVGKSTIAVNLALALSRCQATVGLMDADIYGPSAPIMLGLKGQRPQVIQDNGKHKIIPLEREGVKVVSIGFLVDERQAMIWRGPMVSSALRQFATDVKWGELDYMIVDLPPGTGDIHLTLVQTLPVTGAVIVTTPQEVAMADARKGIGMFANERINVPVLGIVENMSWFTPKELPQNKYFIFGEGGGKRLADEFELPLLGQVPLIQGIREGGDRGEPAVISEDPEMTSIFDELAAEVARQIAIRNASMAPTKRVEITRT
jgi:ATP-binding protein involved in chromosome partitioning